MADAGRVCTLLAFVVFAVSSVRLTIVDLKRHRLPDRLVLGASVSVGSLLAAAALIGGEPSRIGWSVVGAAVYAFVFFVWAVAMPGAIGGGDVKLAPLVGLTTAWIGLGIAFALTPFAIGVVGLCAALRARGSGRGEIAFGPVMLASAWISILIALLTSGTGAVLIAR